MRPLPFFDINGAIGEPVYSAATGQFAGYRSASDLLAEMDRCGVERSLVCHWEALKVHPASGNARLIEEAGGHERLLPCWVVLPHYTGEMSRPADLLSRMRTLGVRAVRLVPHLFGFSLDDWCSGELLAVLEKEHILTIVEATPAELAFLCERFPRLPLAGTDTNLRQMYPLLARYSNLYLSLEGASHPEMVEDVCRRFGPGRLLFGSQRQAPVFPTGDVVYEPGAWRLGPSLATVAYARVSRKAKEALAGNTLATLLGLPAGRGMAPQGEGEIIAAGAAGVPVPARVLDAHFHLGPWAYGHQPGTDVDAALAMMDAAGVEVACVSSASAVQGGDHYRGNREVALVCRDHPDRFVGFGVINPHFPDTRDEIRRCTELYGFRGLKVHPRTHQCSLADPKYVPVWEAAEDPGVLVQAHTGERQTGASPRAFEEIASRYPRGVFHLVHSGDNLEGLRVCLDLASKHPNLYLGTSDVAFMYEGMLEHAVRRLGADRIVFESDCATIGLNHSLGIVLFSALSDRDKALILGGNLARLLGRGCPDAPAGRSA
ncbi:MAG: amidohydrolase family protein [Anaerolineae bacterium]|nr:amidohydrolase family protein [Anaerolineae bacterium]